MTNIRKLTAGAAMVAALSLGSLPVAGATTSAPHAVTASATKTITFNGNYSGTLSLLINGSSVKATSVKGTGAATYMGSKSTMAGSGASSAANTCDAMSGTGSLAGAGSKLNVRILAGAKGCAAGTEVPTKVTVHGTVKVLSGVGKFRGAIGTLSFSGSFTLTSTSGSSSPHFTAKITGKLKVQA